MADYYVKKAISAVEIEVVLADTSSNLDELIAEINKFAFAGSLADFPLSPRPNYRCVCSHDFNFLR